MHTVDGETLQQTKVMGIRLWHINSIFPGQICPIQNGRCWNYKLLEQKQAGCNFTYVSNQQDKIGKSWQIARAPPSKDPLSDRNKESSLLHSWKGWKGRGVGRTVHSSQVYTSKGVAAFDMPWYCHPSHYANWLQSTAPFSGGHNISKVKPCTTWLQSFYHHFKVTFWHHLIHTKRIRAACSVCNARVSYDFL